MNPGTPHDEWLLECPKCGKRTPLSEAGGMRIGAASAGKRTLGYCTDCKRLRWARVVKDDRSEH